LIGTEQEAPRYKNPFVGPLEPSSTAKEFAMKKIFPIAILAALATSATLPAHAQFYAGGSVGRSDISLDGDKRSDQFLDLGFESATTKIDDKDTAYRIFGGYQLHRYFAVEAAYVDLGRVSFDTTVVPQGTLDGRTRIKGFELSAVGMLPLNDDFSLFARVGAFSADTKTSYVSSGSVELVTGAERQKERSTKLSYGAGATYKLTEHLDLRGEYARYTKLGNERTGGETDANVVSIGVSYRF
jgi:OOP family OmpA-OmpF porin